MELRGQLKSGGPDLFDFEKLIAILRKSGEQEHVIDHLKKGFRDSVKIYRVNERRSTQITKTVNSFHLTLSKFLVGCPQDTYLMEENAVRDIIKNLKMHSFGPKTHFVADQCIARICGLFDASMFTINSKHDPKRLLQMLSDATQYSSDVTSAETVFHLRFAIMTDLKYYSSTFERGMLENGYLILQRAHGTAANLPVCMTVALLYITEMYHSSYAFEEIPSQENKRKLIEAAEIGLRCLRTEDLWEQTLWARLIIIRMIFCHLGVGLRFRITSGYIPSKGDLLRVHSLFQHFDNTRTTSPVERKVEMYYNIAKARSYELCGDVDLSIKYIDNARDLAEGMGFRDADNMLEYRTHLLQRKNAQCHDLPRSPVIVSGSVCVVGIGETQTTAVPSTHTSEQTEQNDSQETLPKSIEDSSIEGLSTEPYISEETFLKTVNDTSMVDISTEPKYFEETFVKSVDTFSMIDTTTEPKCFEETFVKTVDSSSMVDTSTDPNSFDETFLKTVNGSVVEDTWIDPSLAWETLQSTDTFSIMDDPLTLPNVSWGNYPKAIDVSTIDKSLPEYTRTRICMHETYPKKVVGGSKYFKDS